MAEPGCAAPGGRAGGRSWCLRRVGMDAEWLLLDAGREVTIGRGVGVTYQLVSKLCPLMISRNHCVLKQNSEGQWTIMDNKSLNGVWLNGERLQPFRVSVIREGDHVQLGVPLEDKENAEYEYEVAEEDWERVRRCLAPRSDCTADRKGLRAKRKSSTEEPEGPSHPKPKAGRGPRAACHPAEPRGKGPGAAQPSDASDPKLASLKGDEKASGACASPGPPSTAEQRALASQGSLELLKMTMARMLKLKTQMQEKQEAVLSARKQTQKGSSKKIAQMEQELQELRGQLSAEQAQQQARVAQLEETFREEEQHLQGLAVQGEEALRQQLARALQEHRSLMEELSRSRKDFETIIQAKDRELEQTKEEKEEVLSRVADVLENELQCIICSEYFIEATTLNCAHSFCSHCISEWMRRKMECPICRKDIESRTRSLVLDNCISKMVDHLGPEVKTRRANLLRERKVSFVRAQKRRTPRI